jgi:hypothetical protein
VFRLSPSSQELRVPASASAVSRCGTTATAARGLRSSAQLMAQSSGRAAGMTRVIHGIDVAAGEDRVDEILELRAERLGDAARDGGTAMG